MQQYVHTQETFSIFYNETNATLKEHNDKLIIHNERIEFYKGTLTKYESIVNRLENQNTILHQKNSTLEQRVNTLEKYVYELNKMMMKFFAYGKTPKSINEECKNNMTTTFASTPMTSTKTSATPFSSLSVPFNNISGSISTPTPSPINTTSPFSTYTPVSALDTEQNKPKFNFGNHK